MQWLDQAGGGLIARAVGAGKTLTGLGFFGEQIKKNPEYKALVAVPRDILAQWHQEGQRFTDLPLVVIPDGVTSEERLEKWASVKPGSIAICSHQDAANKNDLAAIEELGFHGVCIDEPQELKSASGPKGSAALKRIMRINAQNRVALTATPAREAPQELYDSVNWVSKTPYQDANGKTRYRSLIGSRKSFERSYANLGVGTNAQETAIGRALYREVEPYISTDSNIQRDYEVKHNVVKAERTPEQIDRQRHLETNADSILTDLKQRVRDKISKQKRFEGNPGFLAREVNDRAKAIFESLHRENFTGDASGSNGKINALVKNVMGESGEVKPGKHVILIENDAQRKAVIEALKQKGATNSQIANLADKKSKTDYEARKQKFVHGGEKVPFILIDQSSLVGHNLGMAGHFHALGVMGDMASQLQAIGRVTRAGRIGDVNVTHYVQEDNPWEARHLNKLDRQLKLIRASTPENPTGPRCVCLQVAPISG